MSDQLHEDGKVIDIEGQSFECVAVSYRETDGVRHDFVYSFRLKSEVDAEREAAEKAAAEIEANSVEPESTETAPEVATPEEPKEETLHVK